MSHEDKPTGVPIHETAFPLPPSHYLALEKFGVASGLKWIARVRSKGGVAVCQTSLDCKPLARENQFTPNIGTYDTPREAVEALATYFAGYGMAKQYMGDDWKRPNPYIDQRGGTAFVVWDVGYYNFKTAAKQRGAK